MNRTQTVKARSKYIDLKDLIT